MRRPLALACGISALVLLGGCNFFKSKSSKDNFDPPTELTEIEASTRFDEIWSADVSGDKGRSGGALRPALAAGRAFLAGVDGELEARQLESGKVLWEVETGIRGSGGPGTDGRRVVIGGLDGEVAAYDVDGGEQLWTAQLSSEVLAAPLVTADLVVIRTNDGRTHGLEAGDGKVRWTHDSTVPLLTLRGNASPVSDGTAVFVGGDNGKLTALDLSNGKLRWEQAVNLSDGRNELERLIDMDGQVRTDQGDLFVGAYNGNATALVAESGTALWSLEASTAVGVDLSRSLVVVALADGVVLALDRRSGGEIWRQEALKFRHLSAPLVDGQNVVLGDLEGYLHALNLEDGRLVGRTRLGKRPLAGPAQLADGVVVAQDRDGNIAAYRLEGG